MNVWSWLHLLLVIAVAMIVRGLIKPKAKKWQKVAATVEKIGEHAEEVPITQCRNVTYFSPAIRYQFEFNGKILHSNVVSLNARSLRVPDADIRGEPSSPELRWWNKLEVGDQVEAYVNTDKPEEAVLRLPEVRQGRSWVWIGAGSFVLMVWLVLII